MAAESQDNPTPIRLPEVTVKGEMPQLDEEKAIGPQAQPEWTTRRRFSTTRVYLQKQPWEIGFEQWWRGRFFRDGSAGHLVEEELELGLPYRAQLDLYENWMIDGRRRARHHDVAVELRYALADWGKIPLNPTLYGEWKFVDRTQGPDVYELKLLLGEQLAPRWHWAFNGILEQEVGKTRATEWAFNQGLSYTMIDSKLSAGLEMEFNHETTKTSRGHPEIRFLLGPSLQWRPTPRFHVDLVPLGGLTHDSPRVEAFVVFGIDFGNVTGQHFTPNPLRGQ